MGHSLEDALKTIFSDTPIVLLGAVFGMGSSFVMRLVVAQSLGADRYGIIVVGLTIMNAMAMVLLLGFPQGLAREIPRSRDNRIDLISAAMLVSIISSILAGIISITFISDITRILVEPGDGPILLPFLISIPLLVVLRLSIGIFRGLEDATSGILIKSFGYQGTVLLIIIGLIYLINDRNPVHIAYAWPFALLVGILLAVYFLWRERKKVETTQSIRIKKFRNLFHTASRLMIFSLPLMLSDILWRFIQQADTLLLGFFKSNQTVGIYDSAFTLGQLLLLFSWAFGFLFLPLMSSALKQDPTEAKRFYRLITKWISFLTIPAYLSIIFHPDILLRQTFGAEFVEGAFPLAILATGFMSNIITGQSKETIIAAGRTKAVLIGNLFALCLNIVLNVVLIPKYGPVGAASASAVSFIAINLYFLYELNRTQGIHPFYWSFLFPLILSTAILSGLYWVLSISVSFSILSVIFATGGLYVIHGFLLLMSGGLEQEDREFVESILS